jgi:hypothetical protein
LDTSQVPEWQIILSTVASVIAILISSLTLGWTIYRDAIRKPKFRVDVAKKTIVQRGRRPAGPFLAVEALNLGPIPNRVGMPMMRKSWLKRKLLDRQNGLAFVYPDFAHQAATAAGTRLEVGDRACFVFPYDAGSEGLREDFVQFGVSDGFGRVHWCSRKQFRSVKQRYRQDFPNAPRNAV